MTVLESDSVPLLVESFTLMTNGALYCPGPTMTLPSASWAAIPTVTVAGTPALGDALLRFTANVWTMPFRTADTAFAVPDTIVCETVTWLS